MSATDRPGLAGSADLRILQIDVPAASLAAATAFWAGALSADPVPAPGGFVHLHGATSVLEVHLHPLGEGAAGYHLDLESPDRDTEVARLVGLGAREGRRFDAGYTVVEDPAGLPLCVIAPDAAEPNRLAPRRPDRGHLDAVFFDVPAAQVDAEVTFWTAVLGATAEPPEQGSPYTSLAGVRGPGGPVIVEVQAVDAPARLHVDLSAADVAAEAARLEGLGASRVAEIEDWITLADPVGNLLCVVPS